MLLSLLGTVVSIDLYLYVLLPCVFRCELFCNGIQLFYCAFRSQFFISKGATGFFPNNKHEDSAAIEQQGEQVTKVKDEDEHMMQKLEDESFCNVTPLHIATEAGNENLLVSILEQYDSIFKGMRIYIVKQTL